MEAKGQLATIPAKRAMDGFAAAPRFQTIRGSEPSSAFSGHANAYPQLQAVAPSAELGRLEMLRDCAATLLDAAETAAEDVAFLDCREAGEYAAAVEDLSRTVEYLQIVAAGLVHRVRQEELHATTGAGSVSGVSSARTGMGPASPEYRNTGEYLRDALRISAGEARRRLAMAETVLPRTGLTGQPQPPIREELAKALTRGAVSSKAATQITLTLENVRHLTDTPTVDRIERSLTRTAVKHDPDFLARIAKRWTDSIDQDGGEPSEEYLRHRQGAFLRRPRNGLQHLEVFATPGQFEHLITVMNSATNPRVPSTGNETLNTPGVHGAGPGNNEAAALGTVALGTVVLDPTALDPTDPGVPEPWPAPGVASLDRRTRPQRMLDGLIGACKIALATGGLPAAGGLKPQVLVTIGYDQLLADLKQTTPASAANATGATTRNAAQGSNTGWSNGTRTHKDNPEGFSTTAAGTASFAFTGPVNPATIRAMACDADLIPILLGSKGQILDIGRASRVFPRTSEKPSPRATKAARSPAAPSPRPGAKPTTSPTGQAAEPPARTTPRCSAPTTITSSIKRNGTSRFKTASRGSSRHPT